MHPQTPPSPPSQAEPDFDCEGANFRGELCGEFEGRDGVTSAGVGAPTVAPPLATVLPSEKMAVGGIMSVAIILISSSILPLFASAFFPGFPHLPLPHFPHPRFPLPRPGDPEFKFPWPDHGSDDESPPPPIKSGKPAPKPKPEPQPPASRPPVTKGGLREGFYEQTCPQAEKIVNQTIHNIFSRDPTLAPALVRLFFHDCFVTGCDASILLDETPSGDDVEKKAGQNGRFVRGFEAIDEIKTQLEAQCPGVVSCADILAFSARDSLAFTGVPTYGVAAGRRDGLASLARNCVGNLPFPDTQLDRIVYMFKKKGFSLEELVILTGAHSIGNAHCSIVADRFHDKQKSKEIDPGYLLKMQTMTQCQADSQDIPFDPYSSHKMDSRFYKELLERRALLEADHNLAKDRHANAIMKKYVNDQNGWMAKFITAMIKVGKVEVLTGDQGQIRSRCRAVN